jgi:hypothetical protein
MQAIRAAARPLTLSAARTAAVPRVAAGQSPLLLLRGSSGVGTQTTDALALPACVHILSRLCLDPSTHRLNLPARARLVSIAVSPTPLLPTHPHLTSHLTPARTPVLAPGTVRFAHSAAESYDDFNARYADFFANTQDLFELQRGLNNCFAYDLVPSQRGQSTLSLSLSLIFPLDWMLSRRDVVGWRFKANRNSGSRTPRMRTGLAKRVKTRGPRPFCLSLSLSLRPHVQSPAPMARQGQATSKHRAFNRSFRGAEPTAGKHGHPPHDGSLWVPVDERGQPDACYLWFSRD